MEYKTFPISGVALIVPRKFGDDRGFFMETFREVFMSDVSQEPVSFVQDNQSYSKYKGTVRGLHYQTAPHAQAKLVRCVRGAIIDVAVDVRTGSPTYGQHVAVELSAENAHQLLVPTGFLHGFATLMDDTEVCYKCSDYYSKECDGGVLWNDPDLGIDWKIDPSEARLSDKDKIAPRLKDIEAPF